MAKSEEAMVWEAEDIDADELVFRSIANVPGAKSEMSGSMEA